MMPSQRKPATNVSVLLLHYFRARTVQPKSRSSINVLTDIKTSGLRLSLSLIDDAVGVDFD